MVHREDDDDTEDDDEGPSHWLARPHHTVTLRSHKPAAAAIQVCLDGSGETAAACRVTGNSSSDF